MPCRYEVSAEGRNVEKMSVETSSLCVLNVRDIKRGRDDHSTTTDRGHVQ